MGTLFLSPLPVVPFTQQPPWAQRSKRPNLSERRRGRKRARPAFDAQENWPKIPRNIIQMAPCGFHVFFPFVLFPIKHCNSSLNGNIFYFRSVLVIISGSCSRHDHKKIEVCIYIYICEFIRQTAQPVSQPTSQNYKGIEAYFFFSRCFKSLAR